jgi:hypothetical protein
VLSKTKIVLTSTTPRCPLQGFAMAYTGRECQAPAAGTVELPILGLAPSPTAGCRSKVVEISPSWIALSALLTDICMSLLY